MKKLFYAVVLTVVFSMVPCKGLMAQDPIALIIKEGITKVIKAVDLQIQRFQNETIWLQNAQKTLENTMSKMKLEEIGNWVSQQKELYSDYFEELQRVKTALLYYHRVKDMLELQKAMLRDYKIALKAVKNDAHFSPDEVLYVSGVLDAILADGVKNLELLTLVIESFQTKMTDAARLELIDEVARDLQAHYNNLKRFALQNSQISLSRAKDAHEIRVVRALHGL